MIIYLYVKPLFPYYFLLIATMNKAIFANSQQLLIIILLLCELITLHKIHMISFISFYSFLFSFIHSRSQQDNKALESTLIFIIQLMDSITQRDHKAKLKTRSCHKLYSTRSRYYQKDRTKKNGKDKSDGDTIPGHSPKLGSCQGECS